MTNRPLHAKPAPLEPETQRRLPIRELVGVVLVASVIGTVSLLPRWNPLSAWQENPSEIRDRADRAFESQKWDVAVKDYQRYLETSENPSGAVWFRLGYALHALGDLEPAIFAHRQAARFRPYAAVAKYNLACALALQGKKEDALQELEAAIRSGFTSRRPVADDPDFKSLLDDPRFTALASKAHPFDSPSDDDPGTGAQNPGAQNPGAQIPGAQIPGAQNPGAQNPGD